MEVTLRDKLFRVRISDRVVEKRPLKRKDDGSLRDEASSVRIVLGGRMWNPCKTG
jgi:hypothetical protein